MMVLAMGANAAYALSDSGKSALDAFVAKAVGRADPPGVVVLVVNREGVLYHGSAGKQDVARGVTMQRDTIFRIASMTKPITSVAVMMLIEQGKIGLDDPVAKYLPDFDKRPVISKFNPANATFETRAAQSTITIRHLLTNTAGLGYAFTDPTVQRIVELAKKQETELPLLHDPGARWTYSPATRVLGRIVEKVAGEPFDVYLRTRIFAPLAMHDTGHAVAAKKVARVVTAHARESGKLREIPNEPAQASPVRGDGGLYSTAHDYGRFLRMLLNGGALDGVQLLSPRTVKLMSENQIGALVIETQPDAAPARTRPFPIGAGRDKFGLGFQITAADSKFASFRGPGSLSWGGINNTHFWIDPSHQIGAVVMMQVLPFYDDTCIAVLRGIEEIIYRHLRQGRPPS